MKRTTASLLAAGLGFALLTSAAPARAYTGAALSIDLGKSMVVHKAAIPGVSVQYRSNAGANLVAVNLSNTSTPADCASDTVGCEVVPITLNVPESDPDAIEAKGYILTVALSWDPGQTVDNVQGIGTVHSDDLEGYLYQNPQIHNSSGTATYTANTGGQDPGSMVAVAPTSKKFNLVVANFSGVNNGYTLQISLTSADQVKFDPGQYSHGAPKPDYVQPTFNQPPTPHQAGFGGSSSPALGTPPTTVPSAPQVAPAIKVPNIAGGNPDTTLVALSNMALESGLWRHAVKVSSTVAAVQTGKSSTGAIVLTLLALPVLALLTTLVMMRRKRKGQSAVPSTA